MFDGHEFALCLTHDVDRPYESVQSLFYALSERRPERLRHALPWENPYWQFEEIMDIEDRLGVRSSFYFLQERSLFERPLSAWTDPTYWIEHLGRYDVHDPAIVDLLRRLDRGGWEVGLHGSYDSYREKDRLADEKDTLESILGHEVVGGRQHHLNLELPTTWRYHAEIGLSYDTSLGSSSGWGFDHGYDPIRPFDDEFVAFPLTLMDIALPGVRDGDRAWEICRDLLAEAAENDAVMTVLWHPRHFSEVAFPGYRRLYRKLIERALELGGWVGPAADLYDRLDGTASPGQGRRARA